MFSNLHNPDGSFRRVRDDVSIKKAVLTFIAEAAIAPFIASVATKIGEAAGDRIAYHVNPPEEVVVEVTEDESPPEPSA